MKNKGVGEFAQPFVCEHLLSAVLVLIESLLACVGLQ